MIAQKRGFLGAQPFAQCDRDARLANARFTAKQHHLTVAILSPPPVVEEQGQLLVAADERREPHAVQCLEPTLDPTLANDAPCSHRVGETLEVLLAEINHFKA